MRSALFALALGAGLTAGVVSAEAMPAVYVDGAGPAPQLELVSGGCGPAFHRGPFGGCRPNFGGYGYGRPGWRGYGWRGGYGWHRWHRF